MLHPQYKFPSVIKAKDLLVADHLPATRILHTEAYQKLSILDAYAVCPYI